MFGRKQEPEKPKSRIEYDGKKLFLYSVASGLNQEGTQEEAFKYVDELMQKGYRLCGIAGTYYWTAVLEKPKVEQ